eukprot:TRINITY_DN64843_c0_g1_i1.p1 TRINITY_DN64843_c0_g1~~TRINITY_DN64843_c0_g1_i1.p1  ORF type:complete len:303 (+),score=89.16 TRINITY_DN64843_c0_g1_i1:98-1006(+)
MSRSGVQTSRKQRNAGQLLGTAILLVVAAQGISSISSAFTASTPQAYPSPKHSPTALAARTSVLDSLSNPVKTVSDTINAFYKEYPKPPVLPMYRTFVIDLLTQLHLTSVDSRFKYDAIFGLGMTHYYDGLMGSYDKIVGSGESEKIFSAMLKALDMDADKVKADAEAVAEYAKSASTADMLQHMEGTATPAQAVVGEAFANIKENLYSQPFSIGLFRLMEVSGIEVNKANVEEWAKALKIDPVSKVSSDLETYRQNQNKLQKAEEMIREIEIREKKKLAQRLEDKAKALAEKAAKAKAEEK